jgi:hypothetical protein
VTRILVLIIPIILYSTGGNAYAQIMPPDTSSVYRVNKLVEIPVTAALFAGYQLGLNQVYKKPALDSMEISMLDPNDIWKFDRRATMQDASYRQQAHKISDNVMKASVVAPFLLLFDRQIRKDWIDFLILYGQAHSVSGLSYVITTAAYDRNRPYVYSNEVPLDDKMGTGTRNSFFSGHTSTTAVSTFFMAKVLSDYHPELGRKKYLLFAAALVPPAIVGYYRYRAMKHYPTDVFMGLAVGAAAGILVPHFHKSRKGPRNLSIVPVGGKVSGFYMSYRIR